MKSDLEFVGSLEPIGSEPTGTAPADALPAAPPAAETQAAAASQPSTAQPPRRGRPPGSGKGSKKHGGKKSKKKDPADALPSAAEMGEEPQLDEETVIDMMCQAIDATCKMTRILFGGPMHLYTIPKEERRELAKAWLPVLGQQMTKHADKLPLGYACVVTFAVLSPMVEKIMEARAEAGIDVTPKTTEGATADLGGVSLQRVPA